MEFAKIYLVVYSKSTYWVTYMYYAKRTHIIAMDKTVKNLLSPRICILIWQTGPKQRVKIMSGNEKCYEDR